MQRLKPILEAALLAAGRPLAIADLERLFEGDGEAPPRDHIRRALAELGQEWEARSLVLQEVASGYRAQVRAEFEPWVARLWDEKPPRYSRALLETLAIIAYRQPITRSEIEDIRGVSVSTQIMRTLTEREWVRVVGHRDAPGKPAMYGTTRQFLDHFNLKTLDQLPPLSEIREIDDQYPQLAFEERHEGAADETAAQGTGGESAGGSAIDDAAAPSDAAHDAATEAGPEPEVPSAAEGQAVEPRPDEVPDPAPSVADDERGPSSNDGESAGTGAANPGDTEDPTCTSAS